VRLSTNRYHHHPQFASSDSYLALEAPGYVASFETIELGPEQDVELYHDEPLEDTGPSSHAEVILGLGLQYEALSYVWGDASVTTIIEVEVDIEMRRVKGTLRGLDPTLLRVKGHRDLTDPTLTLAGSDH
jgi:hypothetical protein